MSTFQQQPADPVRAFLIEKVRLLMVLAARRARIVQTYVTYCKVTCFFPQCHFSDMIVTCGYGNGFAR